MTTTDKTKNQEVDQEKYSENLFFDLNQDLTLSKKEIERLKKSLEKTDVDLKTKEFFQSARILYNKLKNNNFTISFEEIQKE